MEKRCHLIWALTKKGFVRTLICKDFLTNRIENYTNYQIVIVFSCLDTAVQNFAWQIYSSYQKINMWLQYCMNEAQSCDQHVIIYDQHVIMYLLRVAKSRETFSRRPSWNNCLNWNRFPGRYDLCDLLWLNVSYKQSNY